MGSLHNKRILGTLFDLWWTSNPAYTPQIPRGWVLENDTTLVGFIGNIPVKFLVSGAGEIAAASNQLVCGSFGSWNIQFTAFPGIHETERCFSLSF